MKNISVLMLFVLCYFKSTSCSSGNPLATAACIAGQHLLHPFTSWNSCSENQMKNMFNEMRDANCLNCDKYFHCMGNYKAVYSCSGDRKVETAEMVSNCRDDPSCVDADCLADRSANDFGRMGGNCAAKYLCDSNCKYNPYDKTCQRSNCRLKCCV